MTLEIGSGSRAIILGEVVAAHLRTSIVDARLHVDPRGLDAVDRMGGHGYAATRDTFELPTMSEAEWRAGYVPRRAQAQFEGFRPLPRPHLGRPPVERIFFSAYEVVRRGDA